MTVSYTHLQLRKFQRDLLFVMLGIPIQAKGFQQFMGRVKNGAAGRFVYASGLHTHQPVLHHVHKADTVGAADLIERGDDVQRLHFFAEMCIRDSSTDATPVVIQNTI